MDFCNVEELNAELLRRVRDERDDSDGNDADKVAFTRVMIDWMTDEGGWNGGNAFEFSSRGMHVSGYAFDGEDPSTLDLFVSVFNLSDQSQTMSVTEIDKHFNRGLKFVSEVLSGYETVAGDGPAADLSILLDSGRNQWEKIRIVLLANVRILSNARANVVQRSEEFLGNIKIEFHIWDLDRMFRLLQGGRGHEPVTVDFKIDYNTQVPCLEIPKVTEEYFSCLAVFPGDLLADLYEQYGTQLLEKNVRVFLQDRGKVNRGILETIRTKPQMFLAYNNGISITARGVSFERDNNGQRILRSLEDFQIVNGGQTTASLHNARKKNSLDLSRIFVQAKISVVDERLDEENLVREISLYSNSQNKIKKSDLGADGVFHVALEKLSREIWTPDGRTKWFYERASGQYEVAKQLAGKVIGGSQKFAREFPKSQRILKTDVAKYILAWQGAPDVVSLGGEKCFQRFVVGLRDGFVPDETYFKNLVAKAILFKAIDGVIRRQGETGYKANITAYTMALLNESTENCFNLMLIWNQQAVPSALLEEIEVISKKVRSTILRTAAENNINNVTEWCKKPKCWEAVQSIQCNKISILKANGGGLKHPATNVGGDIIDYDETEQERECRARAEAIKAGGWIAIAQWGRETHSISDWGIKFTASIAGQITRGRRLSQKQIACCCKILDEIERCGINPESLG